MRRIIVSVIALSFVSAPGIRAEPDKSAKAGEAPASSDNERDELRRRAEAGEAIAQHRYALTCLEGRNGCAA